MQYLLTHFPCEYLSPVAFQMIILSIYTPWKNIYTILLYTYLDLVSGRHSRLNPIQPRVVSQRVHAWIILAVYFRVKNKNMQLYKL